jgi:U3 small nucleolar RNA-associated protein 7
MIALDPEFLGGFAPQSRLSEGMDQGAMPFARQPRLHRLHIQGKADKTEDRSDDEAGMEFTVDSSNTSKRDHVSQGKHKMRGKDKSLKRFVDHPSFVDLRSQLASH